MMNVICVLVNANEAFTDFDHSGYPNIDIREEKQSTKVYWESEVILEVRKNRYLRFRGTVEHDHWVGTKKRPMDLCWEYADKGVNDFEPKKISYKSLPEEGRFYIEVAAAKPSVDGTVDVKIDGYWNGKTKKFHYVLSSELKCELDEWYENSIKAARTFNHDAELRARIEGVDYHVEHISQPDIVDSEEPDHRELYERFVYRNPGGEWKLLPKVYLPFPTRRASYPIGKTEQLDVGCSFGFIDRKEGGWMSTIVEGPSKVLFGPCWMFFDVHVFFMEAIPARYSQKDLDLKYVMRFDPVSVEETAVFYEQAKDVPWRHLKEYQQPIFTRNNTFDQLITDGENANKYMWWASSFDCFRDDQVGYDDKYSVSIKHDTDRDDAWYARCWGMPYEKERISGLYRFKAKVKTEDCEGKVRLAVAQTTNADYWVHSKSFKREKGTWVYSKELTGTNDWTELEVIVDFKQPMRHMVLEHLGKGQSWFDEVIIEKID
ncbi:hypothetical protein JD969_00610 [Planctomycetota bacterium]|nr:hypothetical protein JD969_00610 [Planctomycetota bacterium]